MADFINPNLRVITILPPQSVQGVQQPQITGGGAGQVNLVNFPVGSVLSGFIVNRDAGGNPILRTDSGDITFASNFFLKIGSEITIRIEHLAGNTSAHILSVNGQAPEIAARESAFAHEPEVIISGHLSGKTGNDNATFGNDNATFGSNKSTFGSAMVTTSGAGVIKTNNHAPQTIINSNVAGKLVAPIITPENNPIIAAGSQISLKVISIGASVVVNPAPSTQSQPITTQPATTSGQTQNSIPNALQNIPQATPQNSPQNIHQNTQIAAYEKTATATPANPPSTPPLTFVANPQNQSTQPTSITQPAIASQPIITTSQATQAAINQPPQIGQVLTATVINSEANGEALVQTPIGLLRVPLGVQIAAGSEIVFAITQIQSPEFLKQQEALKQESIGADTINPSQLGAMGAIATTPAPITQLARNAGALGDIFSLLSGLGNSDAQNFIENNIPNFASPAAASKNPALSQSANLPIALLLFASALKTGDFREWLGRGNARWLEQNGHENLLKKAEGEFLSLARQFVDVPPQSWQSLFFPIAVDGQLQQVRLFTKRDRKEQETGDEKHSEEDTRFVLEMELTNLGQMQMDGFVRRNFDKTQFDLIIRSHAPLSPEAQNDIMQIYNNTGELTGYSGSLNFQTVKDFPVNPMEEIITSKTQGVLA